MIQPELWMLTPFVLFILLKIPLINADDKSQRKLSDQNENYIITHYGKEYYTPVTDIETAPHRSGFYTAEVIPVDVNTGEELQPVKNLFVPMHTGYSIGVSDAIQYANPINSIKTVPGGNKFATPSTTARIGEFQDEFLIKEDTKSKIPKKFKSKYAMASKKNILNYIEASSTSEDGLVEPNQRSKKTQKRNAFDNQNDFLHIFYDNFKNIVQQHLEYH